MHLVKAKVFPVVMYGCEIWTVKKAEHQRIDAFELWCRRRLLRVPWTARRFNQSILKEISPGIYLEGLMLKLKGFLCGTPPGSFFPVDWLPSAVPDDKLWFLGVSPVPCGVLGTVLSKMQRAPSPTPPESEAGR